MAVDGPTKGGSLNHPRQKKSRTPTQVRKVVWQLETGATDCTSRTLHRKQCRGVKLECHSGLLDSPLWPFPATPKAL